MAIRQAAFEMQMTDAGRYANHCKMNASRVKGALAGLSAEVQGIMRRLLQTPPEPHKAAPRPTTTQAEAQRRRRRKEREAASVAPHDV
jgi:hypothetical protein